MAYKVDEFIVKAKAEVKQNQHTAQYAIQVLEGALKVNPSDKEQLEYNTKTIPVLKRLANVFPDQVLEGYEAAGV
ncbi:MAG: hypothetical protein ACI9YB_003057 [Halioglobus sp.]|jgi:hypothetical protein